MTIYTLPIPQLIWFVSLPNRHIWCLSDTIYALPVSGLTPRLYEWTVCSQHLFFVFSFFITLFCLAPCGRLSWLFVSFWAHVSLNIARRIVSVPLPALESHFPADNR